MYEYFASTLPSFAFGAPPPMSAEELRAAAEGNLRAADLAALYFANPAAAVRDPLPIYLHPAVVAR